ncbi:CheR family methyltransferase [Aquabacterium sp. OR-4]|uniref:CheR family methyltransferase n=1 Tax=Aquabacterium sp. OR-4 TaxID=2978127 RepID=UPI0021B3CD6B|nr:CheR family methyltransferase [Aquabacterium sp. OR-4]MDT7835090.1 CheR family methyltransferase [Aquabacterium sp. OR-4]
MELQLLLQAVHLRYQHDFRQYAPASMRRRMRQAMDGLGFARLSDLQHAVLRDEALFNCLLQYLTVQVSDMFRDPGYFLALREQVLPELATYPSLKLWVAGCSRGEEVWSLAVLLHEAGLLERSIIYATDINPQALQQAESGVFALERAAQFERNHRLAGGHGALSAHWHAGRDTLVFKRSLRRQIVFADHSLATDAVFSELHLVSCRNVLIYFDDALQARAVGLFREALVRRGFLGLGGRETLQFGPHAPAFRALPGLPAEVRWYQRL